MNRQIYRSDEQNHHTLQSREPIPETKIDELLINPYAVYMYVPPIVWKGDCIGHIGSRDTFFWVLQGECFLNVDSQYYLVRPGQLAYLPKGKFRAYTHASSSFCMYEMAFNATMNGQDLMNALGLTETNFVVDIPQKDEMSQLFENAYRKELFRNPIYDLAWCANTINIIRLYAEARQKQNSRHQDLFRPTLQYMSDHLADPITTEELAAQIHMQTNYFIRRFKTAYGLPPIAYLGRLRLYKAMELLASTDDSVEQISKAVGIADSSYFSRFFKKNCGITPREYRNAFRQG